MEVLASIFILLVGLVVWWFRGQKKLTPAQLELLANLARVAVSAAETVGGSGDDKYNLASDGLVRLARRIGIELTPSEVAVLIHAVLREIQYPSELS